MLTFKLAATILLLAGSLGFAEEPSVLTIRILPEDVVQSSIQEVHFASNNVAVRWIFTEVGAAKMIAFWEAQVSKEKIIVGDFVWPRNEAVSQSPSQAKVPWLTAEWKEGWLKRPMDKFIGLNEAEATKVLRGLKNK